jgi:hypothetical protein
VVTPPPLHERGDIRRLKRCMVHRHHISFEHVIKVELWAVEGLGDSFDLMTSGNRPLQIPRSRVACYPPAGPASFFVSFRTCHD